jgi:hypothetical protein
MSSLQCSRMRRGRWPAIGAVVLMVLGTCLPVTAATPQARLTGEEQLQPVYNQGIARVKDGWVLSGTNVLARVDDKLQDVMRIDEAIPPDWAARGFNHIGDIDVAGKYVYAPYEQPEYERGEQAIARYDAKTLAFVDAVTVPQHEASFITVDPKTMIAYSMDRFGGDALLRYDVRKGWKQLKPLRMSQFVDRVQGGDVAAGAVWLSTDDNTKGLYRVALPSGKVQALGNAGHGDGEGEGIDATKLPSGRLHVLTVDVMFTPVWLGNLAVRA